MKKAEIYTRTGDTGLTGLVSGSRIKKSDQRIHLYGEVDELNSFLGLAISHLKNELKKDFFYEIQSKLFDLGSNLACEKEKRDKYKLPSITDEFVLKIENEIDLLNSEIEKINYFILPGGNIASSQFHVCRTVTRRVERQMVHFEDLHNGELPDNALKFINRLSDYFFIVARFINKKNNISEIKWIAE